MDGNVLTSLTTNASGLALPNDYQILIAKMLLMLRPRGLNTENALQMATMRPTTLFKHMAAKGPQFICPVVADMALRSDHWSGDGFHEN
jgi:hypothetical protein